MLLLTILAAASLGLAQGKPPAKPNNKPPAQKPEPAAEGELPHDVNLLLEFIKSEKVSVRRRAAEGLRAMGPDAKEAIVVLTKITRDDPDAEVRRLAAEALAEMGPLAKGAVLNLNKGLFDKDSGVRVASAAALGKIGIGALAAFDSLLKSARQSAESEMVRASIQAAVAIQSKIKDDAPRKSYLTKIGELFTDPKDEVRTVAITEVGSLGRAAKELAGKLRDVAEKDTNEDVKKAAAETLAKVETESSADDTLDKPVPGSPTGKLAFASFDAVLEALKNSKATVRREAIDRIVQMKSAAEPALPIVKKLLREDEDLYVRNGAARALAAMGPLAEPAVKELGLALTTKTEDEHVRAAAAEALGAIGPRAMPAHPALARAWVEDEHGAVRRAASNALFQKIQIPPKTVSLLIRDYYLNAKEEDVRARCADAFGQLGVATKETIAILTKALKDDEAIVRRCAVAALGELGAEAKATIPALLEARNDIDPNVKKRAEAAIRKMDPSALPPEPVVVAKNDPPASKPAEAGADEPPASAPAPVAAAPERPKTLEETVAWLLDGEAGMSRPSFKIENGEIHLFLTLEHSRFDEAMAHTDAVRLSLKFFENMEDLKSIKVSILHNNGKLLSTKTVTAERAKPFLAIEDPFERRRMRDWWDQMAK